MEIKGIDMLKFIAASIFVFTSSITYAGNCATHNSIKVTDAEAKQIEQLKAKAFKAKMDGNIALYEALSAQARNVMEKRQMN